MNSDLAIRQLMPSEVNVIREIAGWYLEEWGTPIDKTIQRLTNPSEDALCFQMVMTKGDELVATGGVAQDVNIVQVLPEYKSYGPWLSLLLTQKKFRNQGFGGILLKAIEKHAFKMNIETLYLSTFTAENLYRRAGWEKYRSVEYKNHRAVIMKKEISNDS